MKDREIACEFYEFESGCLKGREGTFRNACQTCNKYKAKKNGIPARHNLKKQKAKKIQENDIKQMMKDYEV